MRFETEQVIAGQGQSAGVEILADRRAALRLETNRRWRGADFVVELVGPQGSDDPQVVRMQFPARATKTSWHIRTEEPLRQGGTWTFRWHFDRPDLPELLAGTFTVPPEQTPVSSASKEPERNAVTRTFRRALDRLENHPFIRLLVLIGGVAAGVGVLVTIAFSAWKAATGNNALPRTTPSAQVTMRPPVPPHPITGPYQARMTARSTSPPPPLGPEGYWSEITFEYLGQASCEKRGSEYPCFLPLRTAPDFRDAVGVPITRGWPVDRRDWVWVVCQADGNGVPGQGVLQNDLRQTSNRWDLVALGQDPKGIMRYAWGNQIWFTVKGPVRSDGSPRFDCSHTAFR